MGSAVSSSIVEIIGSPVAEVTIMKSSVEPAAKMPDCTVLQGQQADMDKHATSYCDFHKQLVFDRFPVNNYAGSIQFSKGLGLNTFVTSLL